MNAATPRRADRKRVLFNATIITAEGSQQATIKDCSATGVQISCTCPLPVNGDVIFKRGKLFAAARVAWANKDAAGLEFYRRLQPGELDFA